MCKLNILILTASEQRLRLVPNIIYVLCVSLLFFLLPKIDSDAHTLFLQIYSGLKTGIQIRSTIEHVNTPSPEIV